jgi:hypothetical protein
LLIDTCEKANLPCVPAEAMVDIDNDLKTVADDLEAMKKKFRTLTMRTDLRIARSFC